MREEPMGYDEAMAALPAYAAGTLNAAMQAAVDEYLQRQITLFRRLDELEEAAGRPLEMERGSQSDNKHGSTDAVTASGEKPFAPSAAGRGFAEDDSFTQVMEGHMPAGQIFDNPLLMRKAPQAYVDQQSGQRFVIPRRGTLDSVDADPRSDPKRRRRVRLIWGVLALATAMAVFVIALYQRNLQQQLVTMQTALNGMQGQMQIVSSANRALSLRAESPAVQGTLLLREQQALFSISGLQPLAERERYQLWLQTRDGTYRAAAMLPPVQQGATHWLSFDLPLAGTEITGAGVSIEPAGGSVQPTLPMVVESRL